MKNILITGISRGLGKDLFELFSKQPYTVYGLLRNESDFNQLRKKLPDNCKLILADISNDSAIATIQKVFKEQPLDLIINNAGIGGSGTSLETVTMDEINQLFNVHCGGVLRTTQALRANLLKGDNPIVINISSRLGSITRQSNGTYKDLNVSYSYRIAKASQNMLTNCLRAEFEDQIKYISLHPGTLMTGMASVDAKTDSATSAKMILDFWENNKFEIVNGIVELPENVIEW
jgi:short-subunit dehydrogenase